MVMMNSNNSPNTKNDCNEMKRHSIESISTFADDGQKGSLFGGDELVDVFDKSMSSGMSMNIDDDQKEASILQGSRGSIFDGEQLEDIFKQPNDDIMMSTSLSASEVFCSDAAAAAAAAGIMHQEDSPDMKVSGPHKQSMSAPNVFCSDAMKFCSAHKRSMTAPDIFCSTSQCIKDNNNIISELKQQYQQQQQQQQQQNFITSSSAAALELSSNNSPIEIKDINTNDEDKDKGIVVIEQPMPYDIICGRNSGSHNWCGNKRFRVTIMLNLQSYIDAPTREDKTYVIKSVMDILEHDVGARFLKKVGEKTYAPLEEKQIREKVGHAFRDIIYTSQKATSANVM
jgi:hypothetical protein